jgi:hypothetical protein
MHLDDKEVPDKNGRIWTSRQSKSRIGGKGTHRLNIWHAACRTVNPDDQEFHFKHAIGGEKHMKSKFVTALILGLLLISANASAADGDMIVNGKIGVGTTSPSTPLEVNGIIKSATGGIRFPDNTTQTTAASFPTGCTSGQVPKWNGTIWACADDSTGSASGTVSIYSLNGLCGNSSVLTTATTCTTSACYDDGNGYRLYYLCNGSCGNGWTSTCSNTYLGKLVP